MIRTGFAELPLHKGRPPRWLFKRMVGLAGRVVDALIQEEGGRELLTRLSDPFWFQALSCVLGYDWHSSGTTTLTCAVLKEVLDPMEHGLAVAGGKGRLSRAAPREIEGLGKAFGWLDWEISRVKYASQMSAKVDNAAVQSGYRLYHHVLVADEECRWAVVQQGMNSEDGTARRYHWLSDNVEDFVVEPQDAVVCDVFKERVLNMTAQESEACRRASVDLVNDGPKRLRRNLLSLRPMEQRALTEWMDEFGFDRKRDVECLLMPRSINWKALRKAYQFKPQNYEELLATRGVGPSTIRALALISELIYGEGPSCRDPVRFTFCVGGKDGVPFPIDLPVYDEIIEVLGTAIDQAKMGNHERIEAIKRLRGLLEGWGGSFLKNPGKGV